MKFEEMISRLRDDKTAEFKSDISDRIVRIENIYGDSLVWIDKEGTTRPLYIDRGVINANWEEVKKPLAFMELLERIKEDKKVVWFYAEYEGEFLYDYELSITTLFHNLSEDFSSGNDISKILLESQYYICEKGDKDIEN